MQGKQTTTGSTKRIVLVAVFVALLAAGAWYLWGMKQFGNSGSTGVENSNKTEPAPGSSTTKNVVIKEWGVKSSTTLVDDDLMYQISGTGAMFVSKKTQALGCGYGTAGTIERYSETDQVINPVNGQSMGMAKDYYTNNAAIAKKLGAYYYQFVASQASCSDKDSAVQEAATRAVEGLIQKLESN